jgi:transposase
MPLTPRQKQSLQRKDRTDLVLKMLAEGMTQTKVGETLGFSRQYVGRLVEKFQWGLTAKQRALMKKHGNPAEFAVSCCKAGMCMNELAVSIQDYNRQWEEAGK